MSAPRAVPASDKLHYRLSEVCELTDTQPYVLRFWEQEFPQLAPEKSRSGQRLYRREDLDLVRQIKHLLYNREFTISAAREAFERGERVDFSEDVPEESEQEDPKAEGGTAGAGTAGGPVVREISQDLEGLLFDSATPASPSATAAPGGAAARRGLAAARAARQGSADKADIPAIEARLRAAEARAGELARTCRVLEAEKADLARELEESQSARERDIATQADARSKKNSSVVEALKDELTRLRTDSDRKLAGISSEIARVKLDADARGREATRLRRALDHARSEVRIAIAALQTPSADGASEAAEP